MSASGAEPAREAAKLMHITSLDMDREATSLLLDPDPITQLLVVEHVDDADNLGMDRARSLRT